METQPSTDQRRVCVAGGGSWGTALAQIAAARGHQVTLYLRDHAVCDAINSIHENTHYLAGLPLHPSLRATTDPSGEGALFCPLLILAIPCQQQRGFLKMHGHLLQEGCVVVNVAKGIELSTGMTGAEVCADVLGEKRVRYAVLSGPSFAREVMEGRPTAVVVASRELETATEIQHLLSSAVFRCYTSTDVKGVELGGAVKNVIAIASGLCDGLAIGTNARAALLTRGLAEICRLGVALGASEHTFLGLSGLGDLVLTCTGALSRNRTLGLALGRGIGLEEAGKGIGMVTEGVKTAFAVKELAARLGVPVPVTWAVCDILEGKITAAEAAQCLMKRGLGQE